MFLGTAGVGKTCFSRALRKLSWKEYIPSSTIISDVVHILPSNTVPIYSDGCDDKSASNLSNVRQFSQQWHKHKNDQWTEVTHKEEIEELAQLLNAVYDNTSLSNSSGLKHQNSSVFIEESADLGLERKKVEEIFSEAISVAHSFTSNSTDYKFQPFLHFWDCGGQPAFLEMLPAFLTPRTMFFLLFDASKPLNTNWQSNYHIEGKRYDDEEVNMTTRDYMFNWMANIHSHLMAYNEDGGVADYPRMFCIGTHGDQLTDEEKSKVKEELESLYCDREYSKLTKGTLIIDNTSSGCEREDPSIIEIRKKVLKFTTEKLSKKTPLTWVLFRKVLQILDQNIINLSTAFKVGAASKIPHEDVPSVLLFYHDLGAVLYYPQLSGLKDKVIVNPKYFIDAFGKIFSFDIHKKSFSGFRPELDAFLRYGILVQPLYAKVWKSCKDIKPHMFIEVLVHFRLAAEVTTDRYPPPSLQYFVPAVLSLCRDVKVTPPPHSAFHASPLHITFSTGFVTPGFFTRFVTTIACHSQIQLYLKDGVYRNCVTFRYQDTNSSSIEHIIVTDYHNVIQINVFRSIEDFDPVPSSTICQNLFAIIEDSTQKVDFILQSCRGSSFEKMITHPVKRELRYVCTNCPETIPVHYLQLGPAGQATNTSSVLCDRSGEYRSLTDREKVWFKYPPRARPTSHFNNPQKRHEQENLLNFETPFPRITLPTKAYTVKDQNHQLLTKRQNVCLNSFNEVPTSKHDKFDFVQKSEQISKPHYDVSSTDADFSLSSKVPTNTYDQSTECKPNIYIGNIGITHTPKIKPTSIQSELDVFCEEQVNKSQREFPDIFEPLPPLISLTDTFANDTSYDNQTITDTEIQYHPRARPVSIRHTTESINPREAFTTQQRFPCVSVPPPIIQATHPPVNPQELFQSSLFDLCKVIKHDVSNVSLSCVSCGIITITTHDYILNATGVTNEMKANKLLMELYSHLQSRKDQQRGYLLQVFNAFLKVRNPGLTQLVQQLKLKL